MPRPFVRGQVVNAPVLDPQGRNLKIRPCVVIACTETRVAIVGITSTLGEIGPSDRVDLPFSPNPASPCYTGLRRESAANCAWQTVVGVEEVVEVIGHIDSTDL